MHFHCFIFVILNKKCFPCPIGFSLFVLECLWSYKITFFEKQAREIAAKTLEQSLLAGSQGSYEVARLIQPVGHLLMPSGLSP